MKALFSETGDKESSSSLLVCRTVNERGLVLLLQLICLSSVLNDFITFAFRNMDKNMEPVNEQFI